MSATIDDRIVRMQFDNTGFEAGAVKAVELLEKLRDALKLDGASEGINQVKNNVSKFNMNSVTDSIENVKVSFSKLDAFTFGIFSRLGEYALDFSVKMGRQIVGAVSKAPKDGFQEYELQMKSIQTISANSGESMDIISRSLDALNTYADKTVYVFSDMTAAIGRFTAAGLGVEDSTKAIQGFANAAALAGAGPQEMSRGVYQLSQAMSAGVVKLQDWKSIENASIDTAQFRDVIVTTAKQMGAATDGFKKLTNGEASFRESLKDGWLTADIMQQSLENLTMSTRDFSDEEEGMRVRMKELADKGYSEDVAKQIIQIANAADDSAREVRTWTQMIGTLGEAIGTGWSDTWKIILGNVDDATQFFTTLSERLGDIIGGFASSRNKLLQEWADAGGRNILIQAPFNILKAFENAVVPIFDAFNETFGMTGKQLAVLTENFVRFTEKLVISEGAQGVINSLFIDFFGIVHDVASVFGNLVRLATGSVGVFKSVGAILLDVVGFGLQDIAKMTNRFSVFFGNLLDANSKMDAAFKSRFSFIFQYASRVSTIFGIFSEAISKVFNQLVLLGKTVAKSFSGFSINIAPLHGVVMHILSLLNRIVKFLGTFSAFWISTIRTMIVVMSPLKSAIQGISNLAILAFSKVSVVLLKLYEKYIGFVDSALDIATRIQKPLRRAIYEIYDIIGSFFTAVKETLFESEFFKSIKSSFESLKSFIGGLLANIFPKSSPFEHTIAWYFIHPIKTLKDMLVSFGGDNRVQYFKDMFKRLSDTVGGPFLIAFSAAKWVLEKVVALLSKGAGLAKSFGDSIDFGSIFGNVSSFAGSFSFSNIFSGIEIPKSLNDGLAFTKGEFSELSKSATDAKTSVKKFTNQAKAKVPTGGSNSLLTIVSLFSGAFEKLKGYLTNLKRNGTSFTSIVSTFFGDLWKAIKKGASWVKQGLLDFAESGSGFLQSLSGFAGSLMESGGGLLSKIKEFMLGIKDQVDTGTEEISKNVDENKKTLGDYFMQMLSKLPTPSDIASSISVFFTNVKNAIVGGFEDKMLTTGPDNKRLKASLGDLFDFSDFKVVLPDFSAPLKKLMEDFSKALDLYPKDKVDALWEHWGGIIKDGAKIIAGLTGLNWVNSLAKLNRGLGKEGKGIGEFFENMPKSLAEGMGKLGQGFGMGGATRNIKEGMIEIAKGMKAFGQETLTGKNGVFKKSRAKEFMRISEGLLALSGALLVISKIPMEDLEKAGKAITKLAVGVAGLLLVLGLINRLGSVGFIEECGRAVAEIGIGFAGLAVSLWILKDIDENTLTNSVGNLMFIIMTLGGVLYGIKALVGDLTGVPQSLLALSAAVGLLVLPIAAMGYLWLHYSDVMTRGMGMLIAVGTILSGMMWLMSFVVTNGKDMALASIMLLAISVAVANLGFITAILGKMGDGILKGVFAVGLLAAVVTGMIYVLSMFVTNGKDMALAGAGIIAVSVAFSLLAAVLVSLGALGDIAAKGFGSFIIIAAVLTGMVTVMSLFVTKGATILAASIALIPMVTALGLLSVVVVLLGALNGPAATGVGVVAIIGAIMVGLVWALSKVEISAMQIIKVAAALIPLITAIGLMGVLLAALSVVAGMNLAGMQQATGSLMLIMIGLAGLLAVSGIAAGGIRAFTAAVLALTAAFAVVVIMLNAFPNECEAVINGITSLFGWIGNAAQSLVAIFTGKMNDGFEINSPSHVMEDIGSGVIEGFVLGIAESLGAVDESGNLSVEAFLGNFDGLADKLFGTGEEGSNGLLNGLGGLPEKLSGKASEAVNSFVNGIDMDAIVQTGTDIVGGVLQGLTSQAWEGIKAWPGNVFNSIVEGIKGQFIINSPSLVMSEIGKNIVAGLVQGLGILDGLGNAVSTITSTVSNGLTNLPGNVGQFFKDAGTGIRTTVSGWASPVKNGVSQVVGAVGMGLGGLAATVGDKAENGMKALMTAITSKISSVKVAAGNISKSAGDGLKTMAQNFKKRASDAMTGFVSSISSKASAAKSAASNVATAAKNGLSSLYNAFYGVGGNAVRGFVNGMNSLLWSARDKVRELCDSAEKAAKAKLKINSPSKVFRDIGMGVGEGFVLGISKSVRPTEKATEDLADVIPSTFGESLKAMSFGIDDLIDTDFNPVITPVINPAQFNSGMNYLSGMLGSGLSSNMNIGNLNYSGQIVGKIDDFTSLNKDALTAMAENTIDYGLLGQAVAGALIASGVHVEMDSGQLMGYIAGEIRDARRMYR